MAQIQNNKSIHMDMTPLVDLAFLLLTFFILTATFTVNRRIDITFPGSIIDNVSDNSANGITILLNDNKISYIVGSATNPKNKEYKTNNLIKDLAVIKKQFEAQNKKLFVIIQPDEVSTYQSVINTIDALSINDIKMYEIK